MNRSEKPRRLRIALHAYPREVRQAEGDLITSLAEDMIDDGRSSLNREAIGMLWGGLAARAGDLADAPWPDALHRVALWISTALFAIVLGAFAFWQDGLTWPGWSMIATVAAPAAALFGLLAGLRWPVTLGALLLCLLGFAQGNGHLPSVRLEGIFSWPDSGMSLPLLACAIPASLVLLASSLTTPRPASRSTVLVAVAWVAAGAIPTYLLYPSTLVIGSAPVTSEYVAAPMAVCTVVAIAAFVTGFIRRRSDPVGALTGVLALVTVLPVMLLYGIGFVPLGDHLLLMLFALAAITAAGILLRIVRPIAD